MTVVNTTGLDLLGKEVSFRYDLKVTITESSFVTYSELYSGVVTSVTLSLKHPFEIAIDEGEFYSVAEIQDLIVKI